MQDWNQLETLSRVKLLQAFGTKQMQVTIREITDFTKFYLQDMFTNNFILLIFLQVSLLVLLWKKFYIPTQLILTTITKVKMVNSMDLTTLLKTSMD